MCLYVSIFIGDPQIHNSYNATRVMFNPNITEVKDYIERYSI